jgi:TetR/AcrR family transcriptional regulator, transcriptional repressor of bet genes
MGRLEIKELRRTQLIEATIEVIAKRGFAGITLAEVADAAGLSAGIVNFYFKTKEELLVETLRHMAQQYQAHWTTALARAATDPTARLAAMVEADFDPQIASRKGVTVWYAFWGEARWRPEYLRVCTALSDAFFEQTRELCQAIIEAGGYRELDADAVARGLNAMIDGLWLDLLVNPKGLDRVEAKRTCFVFLARLFPAEFAGRALAPTPARRAANG